MTITSPATHAIPTTADEIRDAVLGSTPWQEASTGGEAMAAALLVARGAPQDQVDRLAFASKIVMTGAGSSYYIAQLAAASLRSKCQLPADAAPLSEVLMRPRMVFSPDDLTNQPVVVISRSGSTTEALRVIEMAKVRGQYTVAITCRPESPMAKMADCTLAVPEADEKAIVMTRSFVAQVVLAMRFGTRLGDPQFGIDLDSLPGLWPETAPFVERAWELAAMNPSRVIILGGGGAYGLANEAALKLTETSQISASAYHPLEFRHGPMSVIEPGVLVIGILGRQHVEEERAVVEEAAALGATTWTMGPEGPGASVCGFSRLPLVLHPIQALAFGIAVRRGLDPETPRHLSQVVVLGDDG
jgi:glucosamine--fructose-6-phosphate aminotransferase (isomerizing)